LTELDLRREAVDLLRRLIACDTSNPPGRETQAAAVIEDFLAATGVDCERVAKDPERPNLIVCLRGSGEGPSLAFLGHLDVVPARRSDWSVEPFAGVQQDGAIWGRGTVDMKSQVAAATVALAILAREGFRPGGDLMVILTADEEVGDADVGAPHLVAARPDLRPDYVVGEGAGERIPTPSGPLYLLDCGVKATVSATLTVRGRAGDASLPSVGESAVAEMTRLLARLQQHEPAVRVLPEVEPLIDALAPGHEPLQTRVDRARQAHPALDQLVAALVQPVARPTVVEANGPANVVPEEAKVTLQYLVLPRTTKDEAERELRGALGPGNYELELSEPQGGSTSVPGTPLHHAIEDFLAEHDPEARLVPALGYGFSDCHLVRQAWDSVAYGFIPFRHADPMLNLTTKHGVDERVLIDDLVFQVQAALFVARRIGTHPSARGLTAAAVTTSHDGGDSVDARTKRARAG
jgi:acetylornithine deacetylase/succinyl-diaminopimelate desuccinylase-like protein